MTHAPSHLSDDPQDALPSYLPAHLGGELPEVVVEAPVVGIVGQ